MIVNIFNSSKYVSISGVGSIHVHYTFQGESHQLFTNVAGPFVSLCS
ncbi:unnamed protein product [Chondrus crispus]|uniref:Uncharacterized protein n=1 Tax=Chondrus crispus TaxID=2769 RepID=R7QGU4_CHOCR|nr:unnamed protein product [Chondrus crispus]CDF36686.1 unnamed protein product [Chondrus crispus]|eukprot:XP_005716505.1 unnamed protein product [Chondrus crispus]